MISPDLPVNSDGGLTRAARIRLRVEMYASIVVATIAARFSSEQYPASASSWGSRPTAARSWQSSASAGACHWFPSPRIELTAQSEEEWSRNICPALKSIRICFLRSTININQGELLDLLLSTGRLSGSKSGVYQTLPRRLRWKLASQITFWSSQLLPRGPLHAAGEAKREAPGAVRP